jgi:glutaminase
MRFMSYFVCCCSATDMMKALEIYFMTCSIEANCRAMACVAATLANGGVSPITGSCH